MKGRAKYFDYAERSIQAMQSGIERFNAVHDPYRLESSLILHSNAWELLAKAILLKKKKPIQKSKDQTISAEEAVRKLRTNGWLEELPEMHIQQVISLRNEASHSILQKMPEEITFHLAFFSAKFFKELIEKQFPRYRSQVKRNFLAISFESLTTYADKVQRLLARSKSKSSLERHLVWLLERGIRFQGGSYMSQNALNEEYKKLRGKKLMPNLGVGKFANKAEMVLVIPVQAPKGYTVDIDLRKGQRGGRALPVFTKKTDIEVDYPYLTSDLAEKLEKNLAFTAKLIKKLNLQNNPEYHQSVRSWRSGRINKYSEKAYQELKNILGTNPTYNPWA